MTPSLALIHKALITKDYNTTLGINTQALITQDYDITLGINTQGINYSGLWHHPWY